jgi:hypothetical protein
MTAISSTSAASASRCFCVLRVNRASSARATRRSPNANAAATTAMSTSPTSKRVDFAANT